MHHSGQRQDENNEGDPHNVPFSHLSQSRKIELLNKNGFMYGICVDGNDGPRRSTNAVATYRIQEHHHSPTWIKEREDIFTEVIETESLRSSNYVHHGWSIAAATTLTPWIASGIAGSGQADPSGQWTTKRTAIQRLALDIPLEDLIPAPGFEIAIRTALGKSTALEKFQALHKVFQFWGDVVPIVFELGALLAISDTNPNFARLSSAVSNFTLAELSTYGTARINIWGGDMSLRPDNIVDWLSQGAVNPFQWSQARIIRVIPVIDLLENDLKAAIQALYSMLLSYCPSVIEGTSIGGNSFDGTPHALKTIRSIVVRADSFVDALTVVYSDGTKTDQHGGSGGNEQVFCLRQDEFVIEVTVWADPEITCGIQFITNKGRISAHYGGTGGTPSIINCDGGALSAFSGRVKKHSGKKDMVYRIQTIWRHDTVPGGLTRGHHYSTYYGGGGGTPFNDWPYRHSSDTAYVSGITIQSGKYIESIQATYTNTHEGRKLTSGGLCHGARGGQTQSFSLGAGEYFVKVQGRRDDWIIQLCFITNRGRSSPVYGGSGGQPFECEAPVGSDGSRTRLCFIMGKSSKHLNGLLFVWAPA